MSIISIGEDTKKKENNWESEWFGMPEFVQEDHAPKYSVTIHFRSEGDTEAFFRLINQKRTKRKSYWYPEALPRKTADKIYRDEP